MPVIRMPSHGDHRFRSAIDNRYRQYAHPATAEVCCRRCGARCRFFLTKRELFEKCEKSGGYKVQCYPVSGALSGHGACTSCSLSFYGIAWPEEAYFAAVVPGGTVWAWNAAYLPLLRARISGDKVLVRQLLIRDPNIRLYLINFLSRLPKIALITRHRTRLLRIIDAWMHTESGLSSRRPAEGRTSKHRK